MVYSGGRAGKYRCRLVSAARSARVPFYDYNCLSCGHSFELRQSFDSDPQAPCPNCNSKARRKFHAVPIIYKGSGFYTTDYKKTSYSPPSRSEEVPKHEPEAKKDTNDKNDGVTASTPDPGSSNKSDT